MNQRPRQATDDTVWRCDASHLRTLRFDEETLSAKQLGTSKSATSKSATSHATARHNASVPAASTPFPTTVILRLSAVGAVGAAAVDGAETMPHNSALSLLRVQRTLPLAESIHRALIRTAARGQRIDCPELTGHDRRGQPLAGSHRHAHILPVDIDGDGILDHAVIYAAMGLGPIAQRAIGELRTLFGPAGKAWLSLQPVASQMLDRWLCAAPQHAAARHGVEFACKSSKSTGHRDSVEGKQGVTRWLSLNPFVPPRYLKKSGKNSLLGQVQAELASRNHPPADVSIIGTCIGEPPILQRHPDHAQPPQRLAFRLRLTFANPVCGPICLGYASHFGLGIFRADPSSTNPGEPFQ